MKPKTVARILLAGVIPVGWLGAYLAFRFGDAWPIPFSFVLGTAWGMSYTSLSVELIEFTARRHHKKKQRETWSKLKQERNS